MSRKCLALETSFWVWQRGCPGRACGPPDAGRGPQRVAGVPATRLGPRNCLAIAYNTSGQRLTLKTWGICVWFCFVHALVPDVNSGSGGGGIDFI